MDWTDVFGFLVAAVFVTAGTANVVLDIVSGPPDSPFAWMLLCFGVPISLGAWSATVGAFIKTKGR